MSAHDLSPWFFKSLFIVEVAVEISQIDAEQLLYRLSA